MENRKHIRVLTVRMDGEIAQDEIPFFRGAVLSRIGEDADILFHNHIDDVKYRYSYPLVQYKRIAKKAAIVCIEDGADIVGQFMSRCNDNRFMIGNRCLELHIDEVVPTRTLVQLWNDEFSYFLNKWLPLNKDNFQKYIGAGSLTERIVILEKILRGNLLSLCKGLGIMLTEELKVSITDISRSRTVRIKDVKLMSFDVEFKTNLTIPNNIGIGKNSSIGYGVISRKHDKQQPEEQ